MSSVSSRRTPVARTTAARRRAALLAAAAAIGLSAPAALAQLTVDNGGGTPDIWLIADNWVGNALPTAADDVVLDNSAATLGALFSISDTNAAGDVSAKSLTFGSVNGDPLQAFTLQGNSFNDTAPARAINLATGAISVHASVNGTQTIASSVANGALTLTAGDNSYEFNNNSSQQLTIDAALSGVGATVSSSAGIVRLGGANTYTGTTTVTGGELIIADTGTFNNTASLNLIGGKLTVAAAAANLSTLTTVPVGTTLSLAANQQPGGSASFAPGTVLGTLELAATQGSSGNLMPYAPDLGTDAVFTASGNRTWYGSINLSGTRAVFRSDTTNVNVRDGVIQGTGGGSKVLELTGLLDSGSSASPLITASIQDGAGSTLSVLKTGPGWWRLFGANTFTGGVVIREGTVSFGNASAAGSAGSFVEVGDSSTAFDARLHFGPNGGIARPVTIKAGTGNRVLESGNTAGISVSGTLTAEKSFAFNIVGSYGGNQMTGPINLGSHDMTINASEGLSFSLQTSDFRGLRFTNAITGSGGTITITGLPPVGEVGVVDFSGDNSGLSHAIVLDKGILRVQGNSSSFGTGPITMNDSSEILALVLAARTYTGMGKISVQAGASVTMSISRPTNASASTAGYRIGLGDVDLGAAGVGATLTMGDRQNTNAHSLHLGVVTLYGDSAVSNNTVLPSTSRLMNLAGGVHDDGNNRSLTKTGDGIVILGATVGSTGSFSGTTGADSTYGGNTDIQGGSLRLGRSGGLPATTSVNIASGAVLDLSVAGGGVTNANFGTEIAGLTGAGTVRGNSLNLANGGEIGDRTLTLSGAGTYAFSGIIENKPLADATANNVLSLLKKGVGTQTLSGSNTYTGLTTVEDGTLAVAGSHDSNHGGYSVTGGTLQVSGAISATGTPAAVSATGAGAVSITGTGSLRASTVSSVAGLVNDGTLLPVTSATLAGLSGTGTTTLDGAATLSATHIRQGTLNVNGTAVASVNTNGGDTGTSRIGSLNIAAGAKLDVKDNDLVVTGMSAAAVRSLLVTGFNSGDWAGNGLTSSAAQNDPTFYTALGYADNAELGYATFSGQSVSGTDILVKYTFYGDTDLNGVVDSDDLTNWIDGFNGVGSQVWLYGDFDYSGVVDSDDLTLWVDGFLNTVGPLSASLQAEFSAALASGLASGDFSALQAVASSIVPEPASLSLLALGALALRRRRR